MKYYFYIATGLFFIVLQTTILSNILQSIRFYDLLIPYVIYLSFFCSDRSIFVVLFLGFVMDNLSGCYVGLYVTSYLWLFITAKWIIRFLHVDNIFLLLVAVAPGVLMENFIFLGSIAISGNNSIFPANAFYIVLSQTLWAIFTGLFFIMGFNFAQKNWKNGLMNFLLKRRKISSD